jgi:hypothetical protein
MSKSQLRADFHQLIDNFLDEKVLAKFYDALANYSSENDLTTVLADLSGSMIEDWQKIIDIPPALKVQNSRNPFGVRDVSNLDGLDIVNFAQNVALEDSANNQNILAWTDEESKEEFLTIDGKWEGRWNSGFMGRNFYQGTAFIKSVADKIYILYQDSTNFYLIGAKKVNENYLWGRYMNLSYPDDSTPWVGYLVNNCRIDGQWTQGRWDFRRS